MEIHELEGLAHAVADGRMSPEELVHQVRVDAVTDLEYACVDNQRGVRTGVSEVIYGAGKTPEQIAGIVSAMLAVGQERVLITRLDAQKAERLRGLGCGFSYLGGVTALLAMVNSCASGVSVVNIDNGFGAAYQASLINHLSSGEA